jgi:co-chaperonin GroES (HSP10)
MRLIPLNNQILLRVVEQEEKSTTDSGIILTETEKLPPKFIIEAFGSDVSIDHLGPGDEVILRPAAGYPIYGDDVQYRAILKEDLLVKIETL